jgi:hypothetical protein
VCRRRCPSTRHPEAVREGVVFNQNETIGSSGRDIIIVCRHINVDSAGARIGEQEPVFVCTVEMVKFDEQIPSTIRLYLADDKVSNVGGESLYYLETGLGYQRIQITTDREVKIVRRLFEGADNAMRDMIECAPQVVDSISCRHLQDVQTGEKGTPIKGDFDASRVSVEVVINGQSVCACLPYGIKRLFDISNVLIGPFDL